MSQVAIHTKTKRISLFRWFLTKAGLVKNGETFASKKQNSRAELAKKSPVFTPFYNWEFFRNELEFE
jgi:hypothetical protein